MEPRSPQDPSDSDHDSPLTPVFGRHEKREREDSHSPDTAVLAIQPLLTPQKEQQSDERLPGDSHGGSQGEKGSSSTTKRDRRDEGCAIVNPLALLFQDRVHESSDQVKTEQEQDGEFQNEICPDLEMGNAMVPKSRLRDEPGTSTPPEAVNSPCSAEKSGSDSASAKPLPHCDICFSPGVPKKPATEAKAEDVDLLSVIEVNYDGTPIRPFQLAKNIRTAEALSHSGNVSEAKVFSCNECTKDFKKLLRLKRVMGSSDKSKKDRDRKEREFRKCVEKYCNRRRRNQSGPNKNTVASRHCFLKHKCQKPCSEGISGMRIPTRLRDTSDETRANWSKEFSVKTGCALEVTHEIIDRCSDISLCSVHGSMSRNILDRVEAKQRSCSLCGNFGLSPSSQRVTTFNWEKLRENPETKCIIEDAIAAGFDNTVSPYDIKYLCDGCRRVVLRDINVKENSPREMQGDRFRRATRFRRTKKGRTNDYTHGPTKVAVRMLINWVRRELLENNRNVVIMRDIRKKYDELVTQTGEHEYALKHNRSIRRYIQPSLALTGIFPDVGANKVGTFFYCQSAVRRLAAEAKAPSKEDVELSIEDEIEALKEFRQFILDRQDEIMASRWRLVDYIRAIPHKLWYRRLRVLDQTHMLRRCRARAKLQDKNYFEEWPYNNQDCPTDLQSLPAYDFAVVVALYFSMEREIFIGSNHEVRGPILTALSLLALTSTNVSYLSLLNRIGCAASYQLIDVIRKRTVAKRELEGPFSTLVPRRFVVCGIDNINKRSSHSIAIHNGTYHGYDGLAMQATNSNTKYDFDAYCEAHPNGNEPRIHKGDRMEFIKSFPTPSDPDITAYRWLSVGLAVTNKDRIATDERGKQKSFRRLVMDHLRGFTGGKAKVELVSVRRCDPNKPYEINQMLKMIEDKYNPPGCKELTLVGVVGDQPIFKHFFTLWIDSYIKKTRLCQWMVPIPGGFHIDKQGLIPVIKAYLMGSGFEELLNFSGLSKRHQEIFMNLAHYRKNRRFMSQLTAAMILRLAEALGELDPTFSVEMEEFIATVKREESLSKKERDELWKDPSHAAEIQSILPEGASLALAENVSPAFLRLGKLISEKTRKVAEDSVNMRFFGESQLMKLLIPWKGHNILTRKGQTKLIDKFWFFSVGLLHGLNKIRYQENMLYYAIIKDRMPKNAYHVLYEMGHYVYNASEEDDETNGNHDEGVESGIIRGVKALPSNNPKDITRAPFWASLISGASNILEKQLCPSSRRRAVNSDCSEPSVEKRKYDREKSTASNVLHMLRFLREKKWLGRDHTYSEFITNPLRQVPLVVEDPCFAQKITQADTIGRTAAMMHLSNKVSVLFGPIGEEEAAFFPNGEKAIPREGHWTNKYCFKPMDSYDEDLKVLKARQKRKRGVMAEAEKAMKRQTKRINIMKDDIKDIISSESNETRKEGARNLLKDLLSVQHVLSERAYAYREKIDGERPFYTKEKLFTSFQDVLSRRNLLGDLGAFASPRPFRDTPPVVSVHLDFTDEIRLPPMSGLETLCIGDAVVSRVQTSIKTYLPSRNLESVREVHVHVDVEEDVPLQCMEGERKRRNKSKTQIVDASEGATVSNRDNDVANPPAGLDGNSSRLAPVNMDKSPMIVADVDTQLREVWAVITSDHGNRAFLHSLYAFFGAKAVLDRVNEAKENRKSSGDEGFAPDCSVYIHGASYSITMAAREAELHEINVSRLGDGLLLRKRGEEISPDMLRIGSEAVSLPYLGAPAISAEEILHQQKPKENEIMGYGTDCCWRISKEGVCRFAPGDSFHGQALTRTVFSIMSITRKNFVTWGIKEGEGSIWVASPHEESALLTLDCQTFRKFDIISVVEDRSTYMSSRRLLSALRHNNLEVEDMMLAHLISGSRVCPATQHVPKHKYFEAFIDHRPFTGNLFRRDFLQIESTQLLEEHWNHLEVFITAAYVSAYGTSKGPPKRPNEIVSLFPLLRSSWPHQVRRWVAMSTDVLKPSMLIPDKADIELHVRRALWVLKYWMRAKEDTCNKVSAGGLCDQDGFKKSGEPLLESEDEVLRRRKVIKKPVQTCACKTGCQERKCGCRKRNPPTLCYMCGCGDNCENNGRSSGQPVSVFSNIEERIQHIEAEGNNLPADNLVREEIDYEPHTSDDDDGRYDSDSASLVCEGEDE